MAVGWVIVKFRVAVHPLASVTVTVYAPALKPEAVADVPPDGDHEYVYPPAPPDGLTEAEPFEAPLQDTFVCEPVEVLIAVGWVMVKLRVAVQALASVTVTVYTPALKPVAVADVPPDGDHEYVYPPAPPDGVTEAVPFEPPLHDTLV